MYEESALAILLRVQGVAEIAQAMASGETPAACLKAWSPTPPGREDNLFCIWEGDSAKDVEATIRSFGLLEYLTLDAMQVDEIDWGNWPRQAGNEKARREAMILIVGATGMLGGMITQQLLTRGKEVRILVRENSPSEALAAQGRATSARTLIEAGAQPVYGDMKDRASLDRAMAGVDTVLTTANSALRGGEDNPETVECEGNRCLIDAAEAAGVEHLIFTSALGADPNSPAPFVRGKGETEVYLREGGLTYTILSPNMFAEVWVGLMVGAPLQAGQPVTLVGEGRRVHSFASMADVAAFAVAAVDNPAARNATIVIGGPEALSWRDVVAGVEQVIGREIPVRFVPPGEPVPFLPEAVQGAAAMMDSYDSRLPMADTTATYGVTLTPMATVLQRMFGGH